MYHIKLKSRISLVATFLILSISAFSQDETESKFSFLDFISNNLTDVLLFVLALLLLLPIYYFSKILTFSLKDYLEKHWNSKNVSIIVLFFFPSLFFAQTTTATAPTESFLFSFNMLRFFLITILFSEALVLIVLARLFFKTQSQILASKSGIIEDEGFSLKKWWNKMNNFGELADDHKIDLGHNYDGIRELDNNIPAWFTAIFIFSMLFGVIYMWRYHIAEISPLQIEEYTIEEEEANREHAEYLKNSGSTIDEEKLAFEQDKDKIANGKKIFIGNCATCHKDDGGGGTGPNLTDNSWIYGCAPKDIFQSIKYGRKNGMVEWRNNFSDNEILDIMNYLHSLNGTKPKEPKAPQGDVCTPSAKSDSTASKAVDTTQK